MNLTICVVFAALCGENAPLDLPSPLRSPSALPLRRASPAAERHSLVPRSFRHLGRHGNGKSASPTCPRSLWHPSLLGPSWAVLGPFWAVWGHLGGLWPFWGSLGGLLGRSWESLGALLGLSWAVLGLSWAVSGPSWAVLGPSWAVFGRFWEPLGPSWDDFWSLLGRFRTSLARQSEMPKNIQKPFKKL